MQVTEWIFQLSRILQIVIQIIQKYDTKSVFKYVDSYPNARTNGPLTRIIYVMPVLYYV